MADCLLALEERCPSVGFLGSVLGKTKAQASFVNSHCARHVEACEHRDMYDLDKLSDVLAQHPPPMHRLPLANSPTSVSTPVTNLKPHVRLSVGNHGGVALVDTGWTTTHAGSKWFSEIVAGTGAYVKDVRIQGSQRHRDARRKMILPQLRLGNSIYRHVAVVLDYDTSRPDVDGDIVGMNILLRHPAVCFSWRESLLYLGDLGPCSKGVHPFRAKFVGGHVVAVELTPEWLAEDGETFFALLDTGADSMACTYNFLPVLSTFSFGPHDDMIANCDWSWGGEVLMGMSVLSRFAAFGWELDPLRVYFVPSTVDAANG